MMSNTRHKKEGMVEYIEVFKQDKIIVKIWLKKTFE